MSKTIHMQRFGSTEGEELDDVSAIFRDSSQDDFMHIKFNDGHILYINVKDIMWLSVEDNKND